MELVIDNLHKHFGDNAVLRGISHVFPKGNIYALLGRNGAGLAAPMGENFLYPVCILYFIPFAKPAPDPVWPLFLQAAGRPAG